MPVSLSSGTHSKPRPSQLFGKTGLSFKEFCQENNMYVLTSKHLDIERSQSRVDIGLLDRNDGLKEIKLSTILFQSYLIFTHSCLIFLFVHSQVGRDKKGITDLLIIKWNPKI